MIPETSIALRVDEARVAARVGEKHGVVGRHRVERRMGGKPFDVRLGRSRPLLLVPAASDDPLARLGASSRRPRPSPRSASQLVAVHQVQTELRLADAGEMAVPLDESGDDELPLQIDHLRRRADVALDLGAAAERDDAVAAHRHSFCLRHASSTVTIRPLVSTRSAAADWRLLTRSGRARQRATTRSALATHEDHC